jgi:hypothetical protein
VVHALVARLAPDEELGPVALHVPLVHALVVRCVPVAVRSRVAQHLVVLRRVVLRRVVQVRSLALACCLRLRLLALQRSALAQHPCRERPWSLAR